MEGMKMHSKLLLLTSLVFLLCHGTVNAQNLNPISSQYQNDATPHLGFRYSVSGNGPYTLVLIHGNFDNMETWDKVKPALEKHFRIVTFDLLGFGKSPNPLDVYTSGYVCQPGNRALRCLQN